MESFKSHGHKGVPGVSVQLPVLLESVDMFRTMGDRLNEKARGASRDAFWSYRPSMTRRVNLHLIARFMALLCQINYPKDA